MKMKKKGFKAGGMKKKGYAMGKMVGMKKKGFAMGKAVKPDFIDIDKDGNTEESMKQASMDMKKEGGAIKKMAAGKMVNMKKKGYAKGKMVIAFEQTNTNRPGQIFLYKEIFSKAQRNAKLISEKLDYVGTMCVEYFIDQDDNLLVNEIAPRVHNSGHLTINAFNISQFENHVRAVCDLGLEKVEKISNAEMFNVLGKDIEAYKSKKFNEDEFFYDYGKKSIKDKRKMGHLTVLKK